MNHFRFRWLATAVCCFFIVFGASAQVLKEELHFAPGEVELADRHKKQLAKLADRMKIGERVLILPLTVDTTIGRIGYTGNSIRQANRINDYIEQLGFEKLGILKNFPSGYRGMSVAVNLKLVAVPLCEYGLQKHYGPKPSQFFVIDPTKDTVLHGNEGTALDIPAGALASTTPVKLELKEFYGLSDYMKNGLPTVSDGKMIETGGSIYLDATDANDADKQVKLKRGKSLGVGFARHEDKDGMQVFLKDPNSKKMNWVPQNQPKQYKETFTGTFQALDGEGNVIEQRTFSSQAEFEAFKARIEQEQADRKAAVDAKVATAKKMENALQVNQLGYINCDRFPDEPMQPFILAADPTVPAEYYLVFKDVRGVMDGRNTGSNIDFYRVPTGKTATVVAVSFYKEKAYYFEHQFVIGQKPPAIELKEVSESYVDQKLAALN